MSARGSALLSLRDPAGQLYLEGSRVVRLVKSSAAGDVRALLEAKSLAPFFEAKRIVSTSFLSDDETRSQSRQWRERNPSDRDARPIALEHERIPFVSYPYEWPAEMYFAAGKLTLEIARAALQDGIGLKDATPSNVLFRGTEAVFVDILSFEKRHPLDPTWLPFAQFLRTFILPLLVHERLGVPLDMILLGRRDGLDPVEVYRMCGWLRRFSPLFFPLVTVPAWLSSRQRRNESGIYKKRLASNASSAAFSLKILLSFLEKRLDRVVPARKMSAWSRYMDDGVYSGEQLQCKEAFVRRTLEKLRPKKVLDVGCNTGFFSRCAARTGASVVAIDADPAVVGITYSHARKERLEILPLVVNLGRPSPAVGWNNAEGMAFLERAQGNFDAALFLAVIHHLVVAEGVPLPEVLALAARLVTGSLIVEWVSPEDLSVRHLARGRDVSYLTREYFESEARKLFEIAETEPMPGTERVMYHLVKR